jgi:hypothetical protein
MHYSRTELRSIQPDMRRTASPLSIDGACREVGQALTHAARQAETKQAEQTDLNRIEKKFQRQALDSPLAADEAEETHSRMAPSASATAITEQELEEL